MQLRLMDVHPEFIDAGDLQQYLDWVWAMVEDDPAPSEWARQYVPLRTR
jgi:hypothetical protein